MPLALILNELITNAVKHGVKDRKADAISVEMTNKGGMFELVVQDDGEGFDLDAVQGSSSGLRLVLGLARQINGTIDVTRKPSRVVLAFPAEKTS